jgi:hypothetical protein
MIGASKRRQGVCCDGDGVERMRGKSIRTTTKASATKAMRLTMFASLSGYLDEPNVVMKCDRLLQQHGRSHCDHLRAIDQLSPNSSNIMPMRAIGKASRDVD